MGKVFGGQLSAPETPSRRKTPRQLGYTREGASNEGRNAQFEHVTQRCREFQKRGQAENSHIIFSCYVVWRRILIEGHHGNPKEEVSGFERSRAVSVIFGFLAGHLLHHGRPGMGVNTAGQSPIPVA